MCELCQKGPVLNQVSIYKKKQRGHTAGCLPYKARAQSIMKILSENAV